MSVIFCFFFFFQAEDGIRDYKVTGVQTCALPIYCGLQASRRLSGINAGAAAAGLDYSRVHISSVRKTASNSGTPRRHQAKPTHRTIRPALADGTSHFLPMIQSW